MTSQPLSNRCGADNAYLLLVKTGVRKLLQLQFQQQLTVSSRMLDAVFQEDYGISLSGSFVNPMNNKPLKIWMGSTGRDDLSAGWIPPAS